MGVIWVQHKGINILYSDFSNIRNPKELTDMLDIVDKMYPEKGDKVRHLMNMDNAATSPDFMEKAKIMGKKYSPIGYKDGFIGINPLKKVLLNGFLLFTGGASKAKVFDKYEDALDWLAE